MHITNTLVKIEDKRECEKDKSILHEEGNNLVLKDLVNE